ncbi:HD domain-containing protein [Roseibacterium sp. SDUM158017]|nr:HD domain-containing protein [Roseibacterium sp. SDUM158017]
MLTERFDAALAYARAAHATQTRKATAIPYMSHLMAVSSLVLEAGGDEEQAIAGLLHDAIEDADATETGLAAQFGERVARIVAECSDHHGGTEKAGWQTRKDAYLAGIATKSPDAVLVTTCDKLHNATAILEDLRAIGPTVFDRFTAGRDGTLWYYDGLAQALSARMPGPLAGRLSRVVAELHAEARG